MSPLSEEMRAAIEAHIEREYPKNPMPPLPEAMQAKLRALFRPAVAHKREAA